jgi:cell wall assembly regulator SMI1
MKPLWDRIHVWLAAHAPDVLESLAPGATDEQIRAAEEAMGVTLPDDVRACYRIHNGQRPVLVNVTYWPDLRCVPAFLHGEKWASLDRMVKQWRRMKQLLDGGSFAGISSRPSVLIRSDWWHPKWLTLTEDSTGYVKCLDLAPQRTGQVGQVIFWCHDDAGRGVLAWSFSEWLVRFAYALEAGQYTTAPTRTPGLVRVEDR